MCDTGFDFEQHVPEKSGNYANVVPLVARDYLESLEKKEATAKQFSHEGESLVWVFHALVERLLEYIEAGHVLDQGISKVRPPVRQLVQDLDQAHKGEKDNSIAMLYIYVWRASGCKIPDPPSVFKPRGQTLFATEREHIDKRHTIFTELFEVNGHRRPGEDENSVFEVYDNVSNLLGFVHTPVNTRTIIDGTAIFYQLEKGNVQGKLGG
jgi:hypothetical protein